MATPSADGLSNPHVPDFMAKAPWYLSESAGVGGDMAHQRKAAASKDEFGFTHYYRRGEFAGRATTYRKGACKNCGAMTHDAKSCVERPRSVGAWKSNRDIAPDEIVANTPELSYDAKRDRYNGYNPEEHAQLVELYETAEEERHRIRAEQRAARARVKAEEKAAKAAAKAAKRAAKQAGTAADGDRAAPRDADAETAAPTTGRPEDDAATASDAGSATASDTGSSTDSEYTTSEEEDTDDDVRARDSHANTTQEIMRASTKTKMSVRNLRVREDRAKYLINLDVDSAFYDPKTRSMRENPLPEAGANESTFRGDNEWRQSGLVGEFAQTQLFAWEAAERGVEVHMQANPTQLEMLKKQFAERKALLAKQQEDSVRGRYEASVASAAVDAAPRAAAVRDAVAVDAAAPVKVAHATVAIADADEEVEREPAVTSKRQGDLHVESDRSLLPRELLVGTGGGYSEYMRDGRKRGERGPVGTQRSRYEEDVFPGNHRSVFGSWYDVETRAWGFACCHSTDFNSYCTGEAGKAALTASREFSSGRAALPGTVAAQHAAGRADGGEQGGVASGKRASYADGRGDSSSDAAVRKRGRMAGE